MAVTVAGSASASGGSGSTTLSVSVARGSGEGLIAFVFSENDFTQPYEPTSIVWDSGGDNQAFQKLTGRYNTDSAGRGGYAAILPAPTTAKTANVTVTYSSAPDKYRGIIVVRVTGHDTTWMVRNGIDWHQTIFGSVYPYIRIGSRTGDLCVAGGYYRDGSTAVSAGSGVGDSVIHDVAAGGQRTMVAGSKAGAEGVIVDFVGTTTTYDGVMLGVSVMPASPTGIIMDQRTTFVTQAGSGGTGVAGSFEFTPAAGSIVVLEAAGWGSSTGLTISSIGDNQSGNSYSALRHGNNPNELRGYIGIWAALNVNASGTFTITPVWNQSNQYTLWRATSYVNVKTASALGANPSMASGASSAAPSIAITPTANGSLIVGVANADSAGNSDVSWVHPDYYRSEAEYNNYSAIQTISAVARVLESNTAQTITWASDSANWAAIAVELLEASAGGGSVSDLIRRSRSMTPILAM